MYEGNFKNNKIEGKGVKFYKNGSKKIEGIFDTLNLCEGIYYSPENKEIYRGKILNEITINCKKGIIYNDNICKLYEGNMYKGIYEGYGIEYCPFVENRIIYNGYFKNNYFLKKNLRYNNNNLKYKKIKK